MTKTFKLHHVLTSICIMLLSNVTFSQKSKIGVPLPLQGKKFEGYIKIHVPAYRLKWQMQHFQPSEYYHQYGSLTRTPMTSDIKAEDTLLMFNISFGKGRSGKAGIVKKGIHATFFTPKEANISKETQEFNPIRIDRKGKMYSPVRVKKVRVKNDDGEYYKITVYQPYKKYNKKTFNDYKQHKVMFYFLHHIENKTAMRGVVKNIYRTKVLKYPNISFSTYELYNRDNFTQKEIRKGIKKILESM